MKILVIGATGMLGHRLALELPRYGHEVWAAVRGPAEEFSKLGITEPVRSIGGVDVTDLTSVDRAIEISAPEVVINAAGIVKQRKESADPIASIGVNALFPHQLMALASNLEIRVLTISTDCVFTGNEGGYSETDTPDATDLYGRSKLLGELDYGNSLTIRTSIIGRELEGAKGLLEWFLENREGEVRGYSKAYFSGLTTIRLAKIIGERLVVETDLRGIYHLASERISKYELLSSIRDALGINVKIEPFEGVEIDRSLDGSKLLRRLGLDAPNWREMIDELAEDKTPYETWRTKNT